MISQKIEFADDEEDVDASSEPSSKLEIDNSIVDKDETVKKSGTDIQQSIERAKIRRAEEEKRLSELTKARCAEKLRLLDMKKQTNYTDDMTTSVQQQQQTTKQDNQITTTATTATAIKSTTNVPGYPIRPPPPDLLSSKSAITATSPSPAPTNDSNEDYSSTGYNKVQNDPFDDSNYDRKQTNNRYNNDYNK